MANDLVPQKPTFVPEVVDDQGNKLEGPQMEAVTSLVTQMAQLAQLARIRKALERRQFEGHTDSKILNATSNQQFLNLLHQDPYHAWATAAFTNNGLGVVYIALNNDNVVGKPVAAGGVYQVDFRDADRRIEVIAYHCDPGGTATVLADGKY